MKKLVVLLILLILTGCTGGNSNSMMNTKNRNDLEVYFYWKDEAGVKYNSEVAFIQETRDEEANTKIVEDNKKALLADFDKIVELEKKEVSRNEVYDREQLIFKNLETEEFVYLFQNGGMRYIKGDEEKSYICSDANYETLYQEMEGMLLEIYNIYNAEAE